MACIDAHGNITRTAEVILLALIKPGSIEHAAEECDLALFRVRSAVRELSSAGLLAETGDMLQATAKGVDKLEGRKSDTPKI